jgi:hypothetical protein
MLNLKWGAICLLTGAALFVLSDTLFGESDAASYSAFLGGILFLVGLILAVAGAIQALVARVRRARK